MVGLLSRFLKTGLSITCLAAIGLLSDVVCPRPVSGAEEIQVILDGPLSLELSVNALEQFAETGETTGDLGLVIRFLPEALQANLRQQLQRPIPLGRTTISTVTYSPLGRDVLVNLGKVVRVHPEVEGFYGLRAALLQAAGAGPNNWTVIDVLRAFPSERIHVRLRDLLALRRTLTVYFDYNQAVVSAIERQADAEAEAIALASEDSLLGSQLTELSQPGPHSVARTEITVKDPSLRQTEVGLTVNYDFPVDVYYPETRQNAPILIVSHGFGDEKTSFAFIAEHLASHGYAVMLPAHVGSDLSYRQAFLEGGLNTLLSPMEFLNRPQEISFLIDELERRARRSPLWARRLDLSRIAIMGDSLGGSTALSLAGAEINYARLQDSCSRENVILNVALYLECRAQFLPPQNYQLRDERIRAVVTTHPMGGYLYGPEGMSQVTIPWLTIAGSNDVVAPVVTEQIYPFVWAASDAKYLALLQVGTHFTSKPGRINAEGLFSSLIGEHRLTGSRYAKALILEFLQTHLAAEATGSASPLLTAAAGRGLSAGEPLQLHLIRDLTAAQIEAAYGRRPPIPISPPAIATPPTPRDTTVLDEIRRSGALKIGFRKDAPPLGYINADDQWDGYCGDMAIALGNYLTAALDAPIAVELVELTSTLQNRFDLVRAGDVHLECGPNTIRTDVEGVTFSSAILVAGTRFLVPKTEPINPNRPLAGARLGVLRHSTAEDLVRTRYPEATVVPFAGGEGRQAAVEAVNSRQIEAFVGDDLLTYAALQREGIDTADFALVPEQPLSCEFYGLILPEGDPDWTATVNAFLRSDPENAVFMDWFGDVTTTALQTTNFCLNRR